MSELRWYREIQSSESGPNAYLTLTFLTTAPDLEQQLISLLQSDYELFRHSPHYWVNRRRSDWCYTTVTQQKNTVTLHLQWAQTHAEADRFLDQLLFSTSLTLSDWQIMAGGDGYRSQAIQSGQGLESFWQYAGDRPWDQLSPLLISP